MDAWTQGLLRDPLLLDARRFSISAIQRQAAKGRRLALLPVHAQQHGHRQPAHPDSALGEPPERRRLGHVAQGARAVHERRHRAAPCLMGYPGLKSGAALPSAWTAIKARRKGGLVLSHRVARGARTLPPFAIPTSANKLRARPR